MTPIPTRAATLAAAIHSLDGNVDAAGLASMIAATMESHDTAVRARLGRAHAMWSGGLDGPPPSVDELESHAIAGAKLARVMALDDLARSLALLDGAVGMAAVDAIGFVVRNARRVSNG